MKSEGIWPNRIRGLILIRTRPVRASGRALTAAADPTKPAIKARRVNFERGIRHYHISLDPGHIARTPRTMPILIGGKNCTIEPSFEWRPVFLRWRRTRCTRVPDAGGLRRPASWKLHRTEWRRIQSHLFRARDKPASGT